MATAAILTAAPLLEQVLLPLLVKGLDKIFPPGSGPAKLTTAANAWAVILHGLNAAFLPPAAGPPTPAVVTPATTAAVQATVDDLEKKGELKGAATVIGAPAAANAQHILDAASGIEMMLTGFAKVLALQAAVAK